MRPESRPIILKVCFVVRDPNRSSCRGATLVLPTASSISLGVVQTQITSLYLRAWITCGNSHSARTACPSAVGCIPSL